MSRHIYNGLVLFDIDGTLTTGTQNEEVVQYFLDRNYAVGITTAGTMYHPCNLLYFSWMPRNLYFFMVQNNFDTFSNVGSGILCGDYNLEVYDNNTFHLLFLIDDFRTLLGAYKGVSLETTGLLYEITDPKKIILIDNDPYYLKGASIYNNNFVLVSGGKPASAENLSMHTIYNYL